MGSLFRRISGKAAKSKRLGFEQISYQAAYSLLPYHLFADPMSGNREFLNQAPRAAGIKHLVGVCLMANFEPDEPLMNRFAETQGHSGELCEGVQYRIIEYPKPDPIDLDMDELDKLPPEDIMKEMESVILAPYFSVVLLSGDSQVAGYLILGQSPDGGTTLRRVEESVNANLGPGCEPRLEPLLTLLRARQEQPA